MNRISLLVIAAAIAIAVPSISMAAKTTYIATNHRFDFVKLQEVKPSEAEMRSMTHPVTLDEQGLRSALESVMLSRSYIIKKEVDTQRVFDDGAVSYLAHNFSIAFAQAKPNEKIVFSYLTKDPIFILRNDRITLGEAWMQGDELHIKFKKLYAKLTGDTDKRGNESKAVAKAKGLRIQLDLQPGQMMAVNDPEELLLNINYNYAADVQKRQLDAKAAPASGRTMSGEEVTLPTAASTQPQQATVETKSKSKSKAKNSVIDTTRASGQETIAEDAVTAKGETVEQRLRTLESLRKDGLISDKEYKEKKKEIMNDL